MNHARASGAPMRIKLGETERTFRRLSRRDFSALMERMPVSSGQDRMFYSPFDVHRWAASTAGAPVVLAVALCEQDAKALDIDEMASTIANSDGEWGSMIQQSTVAAIITAESLTLGEHEDAEGEESPDPT